MVGNEIGCDGDPQPIDHVRRNRISPGEGNEGWGKFIVDFFKMGDVLWPAMPKKPFCKTHFVLAFKDEAGSRANAQLFRSAAAIFRSIQLRALPLRTLTLGVLIVSGGTLAALPFRRYQAIPDASSAPLQVTGPSHSALDSPQLESVEANSPPDAASGQSGVNSRLAAAASRPWPQPVAPPAPRTIDIPLTYEDLAQPIDQPAPIQRRYSATAMARQKQIERQRATELVMPAMESLALSQQQELEQAMAAADRPAATSRATGTLASSTSPPERNIQPLPEAASDPRQRHWIRQPD